MTEISVSDVQKLAQLSALSLTEGEAASLANELTHILGYVDHLNEVDTDGVEPTYQVTGLTSVTRKDEIIEYGVSRDGLLANAPEVQDGQIKVPKVFE